MMGDPNRTYSTSNLFEMIDIDEYSELVKKDQDVIHLILSCNHVDLTDNGKILNLLYNIFPSGVTRDNLENLIYYESEI